jgi:hypothetical protein
MSSLGIGFATLNAMIDPFTHTAARPGEDAAYQSWQASARKTVMRLDPSERTAGPIPTFGSMVHDTALAAQGMNYAPGDSATAGKTQPDIAYAADENEFSFGDVLDVINPLQHLPVIGTIYRKFTGDTMKPFSNILGGAIFGGPVGAVASTVNVCLKSTTGKDITENAMALVGFDVTPPHDSKPDITYGAPVADIAGQAIPRTASFDVAANAYTASGQKNFSVTRPVSQSWNA